MTDFQILKDAEHGLITVSVGNSFATMTIGEWSKIIAAPRAYRKPGVVDTAPSEYCAPGIDPA